MKQREEKGVTLLVLTITIIVLLIITSITIGNFQNQLGKKKLNNLYSDIEAINAKISEYYLKNNSLPIFEENAYMNNSSQLKLLFKTNGGKGTLININDENSYYVINLSKLENLTLNYGREYSNWDNNSTYEKYQDVYIINETTHQVYYPKGVKYNGRMYFTTTLPEEIEKIQSSEIPNEGLELTVGKTNKNYISDSDKVILDTEITLDLDSNFIRDTLEYSWNVTQDKNVEYTKFELNQSNKATLMSKQLDNINNFYLNIKVLDINGKEHILEEKIDNLEEKLQKGKIVIGNNVKWKDETNEYPAIIPVGFCVVKGAGTIEEGLVISDVEDDDMENTKHGNQFVWIPVNDYSKFHLIEGYSSSVLQKYISQEVDPSREAGDILNVVGRPMTKNSTKGIAESVAMYNSVKNNHGFYIARFEAGIEGTTDNYSLSAENKKVADGKTKPLSKKGVGVWNEIPWGGTSSNTASDGLPGDDTANGAVKVARSMYTKSNTCGVTSTLCYGVQWDAVMNFIDTNYVKEEGNLTSFVANSEGNGNYGSSSAKLTGYYEVKNIYDLGGNMNEWTMEAYDSNYRLGRGGHDNVDGSYGPASARGNAPPSSFGVHVGFRIALYL